MLVEFKPIGTIYTPYYEKEGMPIQSKAGKGVKGKIIIQDEFVPGLKDLDGFSHLILIYHFHRSEGFNLLTKPFLDDIEHGVFATRAPKRPNAIGFSVVKLSGIIGNQLNIENVDILNETPLLDIKPYIPEFDIFEAEKTGWLEKNKDKLGIIKSDSRFD